MWKFDTLCDARDTLLDSFNNSIAAHRAAGSEVQWLFWGCLAFFLLIGVLLFRSRARIAKGVRPAPGFIPYFGHMFEMKRLIEAPTDEFLVAAVQAARDNNQKPYGLGIPNKNLVVRITTEAAAKHVLKDKFTNYIKIDSEYTKLLGVEFFGERGIFVLDGKPWEFERKVASRMFAANVLNSLMESTFLEHGEIVMRILGEAANKGEVVEMQDLMKRFTMDSISRIGFGAEFGSLERPNDEFSIAFDALQETIIRRVFRPELVFRIQRALGIGFEKEVVQHARVINETVGNIIKSREEKLKGITDAGNGRFQDLLSQFIIMTKKRGEEMDAERARDVVMNFLIAGRDTTACLLTWTFYELSKHPDLEQKVLAEMNEALKDEPLSHETIKKLPYTDAFLSEVLRLHPPVPFDTKRAVEDDVLPDGTEIPSGTVIQYSPYIFGRMPWHWEDPDCFNPERWVKEPNPSDFKFITFNAGPRLCLGKKMAYMEAKMLLCMILPEFQICVEQDQNFAPSKSLILWFGEGLKARPVPRSHC